MQIKMMKNVAGMFLLLIPVSLLAQNYQGMSEADMQKMMQQMQEAQSCMEKVDQAALGSLQERAAQVDSEMKALCARGERDKAQKKAIAFGKQMQTDPAMQAMGKCSEKMKGVMPEMSFSQVETDDSAGHVCDQ